MYKNLRSLVPLLVLAACLLCATSVVAQVVEVKVEPDGVYFVPTGKLGEGGLLLTVSGPEDCFLERAYPPGKVAEFGILDEMDEVIPDGSYSYQVTHRPVLSPEHRKILAEARERNDPKEIKDLKRRGIVRERFSQSGYLTVHRGQFVFEDLEEERQGKGRRGMVTERAPFGGYDQENGEGGLVGAQLADFVINDDLIVDGSACIGFDCVNGEVFGFDTIRLKENNLRIKFDDTSVVPSFPANDWQLTANESANGGASKFSIEDISGGRTPFTVEANARSHSLYVDDGGRIGSRTSTPSTEIHTIDGDTPTLRLQQDGSSGFDPQTWDVAGNETNFFIRDVTNGSTLPFRIRPGAPSNSIFIDVDGDVGIGTSSPDAALHVRKGGARVHVEDSNSSVAARELLALENHGGSYITMSNTNAGVDWFFTHENNAPNRFLINDSDGSGVDFALTGAGDLTIAGTLVTGGPTCAGGCDDVLKPDYELPSIEEHGQQMLDNSYLPEVGPTLPKQPINITEKTGAILNELEKAHLYILQLHDRLKVLEQRLSTPVESPLD